MINPYNFGQDVSHPHSDRAGLERDHRLGLAQGDASKVPRFADLPVLMEVVLPCCLSGRYTHWAAVGLFVYFGAKLLLEAPVKQSAKLWQQGCQSLQYHDIHGIKIFKDWCHLIFLCNPGDMSWLWGSANAAKWQWLWVADSVEELLGSYVLVLRTRWVALEHRMPGKSALHQPPLAQSSDVGSSMERLIQVLWQHFGHAHWNDEVWIFPDAVA